MNYNNESELQFSKYEYDELSELFITDSGGLLQIRDAIDYKLSSISKQFFNSDADANDYFNSFSIELLDAILNYNFEFGMLSTADIAFNKYHDKFGVVTIDWLSRLFLSNLSNPSVCLGIILIMSRQNINDLGCQGQMLLITATFKFKNDMQIQDAIIRCIENWESYELVSILDNLHPNEKWLADYKDSVINDLKECHTI